MIAKIGNEDQEKLGKMKKLMDILSNPTKRMPMETLLKCEAVLERMNLDAPDHMEQKYSAPVAATPPPISSSSITPLLEAIVKLKNNKVCVLHCDEPLKITERNHPEIIHYDSTNTVIMFLGFHQLIYANFTLFRIPRCLSITLCTSHSELRWKPCTAPRSAFRRCRNVGVASISRSRHTRQVQASRFLTSCKEKSQGFNRILRFFHLEIFGSYRNYLLNFVLAYKTLV
jgi:hypothetical protein